jgi:hypothetical protein
VLVDQEAGPAITNDGAAVAHESSSRSVRKPGRASRAARRSTRRGRHEHGDGAAHAIVRQRSCASPRAPARARPPRRRARRARGERPPRAGAPSSREERVAVAAIGAAGDLEAARRVEDAVERAGAPAAVLVRAAHARTTRVVFAKGAAFDGGWLSPYFVTDPEEMRAALEDPLVLLADQRLTRADEIAPALALAQEAGLPLLVVAEDVEGEALQTLVVNQLRGVARSCAVRRPARATGGARCSSGSRSPVGRRSTRPTSGAPERARRETSAGSSARWSIADTRCSSARTTKATAPRRDHRGRRRRRPRSRSPRRHEDALRAPRRRARRGHRARRGRRARAPATPRSRCRCRATPRRGGRWRARLPRAAAGSRTTPAPTASR